jgi:hypothetical protein
LNFGKYIGKCAFGINLCVEIVKKMKPKNAPRDLTVPYKHIKVPTCTYFDYNCGHPQGDVYTGYITKALRTNANVK